MLTELGKASVHFSISYTRSWTLLQAVRTLPDCRQCISKSLLLASKAVAAIPQFPWLILAWLLLPNSTDLTELLEALARRLRFDADRFPRRSGRFPHRWSAPGESSEVSPDFLTLDDPGFAVETEPTTKLPPTQLHLKYPVRRTPGPPAPPAGGLLFCSAEFAP